MLSKLRRLVPLALVVALAACESAPAGAPPPAATSGPGPTLVAAAAAGLQKVTRADLEACAVTVPAEPPQVPARRIVPICESDDERPFFASGYSVNDMRSIWSAYRLTRVMVTAIEKSELERFSTFIQNPQLKALKIPQPSHSDYTNNPDRYQRGHYTPSETTKWDEGALRASFQVTNIAPQHGGMNGSIWRCYEETIRGWAKKWGTVQVVVGGSVPAIKSIGAVRKITVPKHYFAVVYRPGAGTAVGVAIPNEEGFSLDIRRYMMSVAAVEDLAGVTFGLPASVKNAQPRPADWPALVAQIPFFDQDNMDRNKCVPA